MPKSETKQSKEKTRREMIEILTSKVFDSIYSDETEWNSKKENSEKTQIDKGETTGVTVKSDESKEAEGVADETSD